MKSVHESYKLYSGRRFLITFRGLACTKLVLFYWKTRNPKKTKWQIRIGIYATSWNIISFEVSHFRLKNLFNNVRLTKLFRAGIVCVHISLSINFQCSWVAYTSDRAYWIQHHILLLFIFFSKRIRFFLLSNIAYCFKWTGILVWAAHNSLFNEKCIEKNNLWYS